VLDVYSLYTVVCTRPPDNRIANMAGIGTFPGYCS